MQSWLAAIAIVSLGCGSVRSSGTDAGQPDADRDATPDVDAAEPGTVAWQQHMFGTFPAISFHGENLLFRASRHDPNPIDLGGGPIPHVGASDLLVGQFDTDGGHIVSAGHGGVDTEFANGGAVSLADGSFILSGLLGPGTTNVGGNDFNKPASLANLFDSYLARFGKNGNHLWSIPLQAGASSVFIASVVPDGAGGAVAIGWFDGAFTVGGKSSPAPQGGRDIFLVRVNADGEVVGEVVVLASVSSEEPASAVSAGAGELYVCGTFKGTLQLGTDTLVPVGTTDVFVASITPAGEVNWATSAGGTATTNCRSITVTGDLLITGDFVGTTTFPGGSELASDGAEDIYVAQLRAADGGHIRSFRFGGPLADRPRTIAAAADGTIALTGEFSDVIDFGGGNLVSAGEIDLFLTRLTLDGQHIWSIRAGDTLEDRGLGVLIDSAGALYVTGSFHDSIDFGDDSVLTGPPSVFNGFIVKIH